jgi:hypothetical protein
VESLSERIREEDISKKDVWTWITENMPDGYSPPPFQSWTRYLRDIPSTFSGQKRSPRAVPTGKSVVPKSAL